MKRKTKISEANEGGGQLIDAIIARGARSMEQVVDRRFGLVFDRWILPNGTSVVSMLAPEYREVFIQPTPDSNKWADTFAALDVAAGLKPAPTMVHLVAVLEAFRTCIGRDAFAEFVTGNEAVGAAADFAGVKP
jgi:hypothetical protein